jgi:MFS family permease
MSPSATPFYGWRVMAAAGAIQFMLGALLTQSFGLYIAALSAEMGWSKTTLAGAAALQSVESALIGPVLGFLLDRYGTPRMVRVGLIVFSVGLALLSQVESVATFYVSAVLMAVGASLGGYFPLSVTLVQWFRRYRARALSVSSMGLALGGLVVPLMAMSMQRWGWRSTAGASAVVALVLGLFLSRLILRRPEDHGQHVDGIAPQAVAADATSRVQDTAPEFTAGQALRTRAFWLLAIGHALALLVVTAVNVHAVTHMREGLGHDVSTAGWIIMLMTFCQLMGVGLGFLVGDRFNKRFMAALCMLAHALGLLSLTYAGSAPGLWGLWAFSLFHGAAWGLRGPFMQAIRADYFGRNAIGFIFGLSATLVAVGQIGGPMIAGLMADLTGDYRAGFTLLALLSALGSLAFIWATPPARPRPPAVIAESQGRGA